MSRRNEDYTPPRKQRTWGDREDPQKAFEPKKPERAVLFGDDVPLEKGSRYNRDQIHEFDPYYFHGATKGTKQGGPSQEFLRGQRLAREARAREEEEARAREVEEALAREERDQRDEARGFGRRDEYDSYDHDRHRLPRIPKKDRKGHRRRRLRMK